MNRAVYDALMAGYRLIDTAAAYKNEEAVGKAVIKSEYPEMNFLLPLNYGFRMQAMTAQRAFEESLKRLQTDYLDLYLIHQPFGDIYSSGVPPIYTMKEKSVLSV